MPKLNLFECDNFSVERLILEPAVSLESPVWILSTNLKGGYLGRKAGASVGSCPVLSGELEFTDCLVEG